MGDALATEEDAAKALPNGEPSKQSLRLAVLSWNLGDRHGEQGPPAEFWWLPKGLREADLVAVGLQEASAERMQEWAAGILRTIGDFELVYSAAFGTFMPLMVFARPQVAKTLPREEDGSLAGSVLYFKEQRPCSKGSVSCRTQFNNVSLNLVNCHLESGLSATKLRDEQFRQLLEGLGSPDRGAVILFGDLNYRIEPLEEGICDPNTDKDATPEFMVSFERIAGICEAGQWQPFLVHNNGEEAVDQLLLARNGHLAEHLQGFSEADIAFAPTYKRQRYSIEEEAASTEAPAVSFCRNNQRIPGWVDRVLFRASPGLSMKVLAYDAIEEALGSDHRPVWCLLEVEMSS